MRAWILNPVIGSPKTSRIRVGWHTHASRCIGEIQMTNTHAHTHTNNIAQYRVLLVWRDTTQHTHFSTYKHDARSYITIAFYSTQMYSRTHTETLFHPHTHGHTTCAAHYNVKPPPSISSQPPPLPPIATDNNLPNITHSLGQSYCLTCGECHVQRELHFKSVYRNKYLAFDAIPIPNKLFPEN